MFLVHGIFCQYFLLVHEIQAQIHFFLWKLCTVDKRPDFITLMIACCIAICSLTSPLVTPKVYCCCCCCCFYYRYWHHRHYYYYYYYIFYLALWIKHVSHDKEKCVREWRICRFNWFIMHCAFSESLKYSLILLWIQCIA